MWRTSFASLHKKFKKQTRHTRKKIAHRRSRTRLISTKIDWPSCSWPFKKRLKVMRKDSPEMFAKVAGISFIKKSTGKVLHVVLRTKTVTQFRRGAIEEATLNPRAGLGGHPEATENLKDYETIMGTKCRTLRMTMTVLSLLRRGTRKGSHCWNTWARMRCNWKELWKFLFMVRHCPLND